MKQLLILAMIALTGCSLDSSLPTDSGDPRLQWHNEPVSVDTSDVDGTTLSTMSTSVSAQGLLDPLLSLTPTLTLVGTLSPPYVNGSQLQASDITVNGTKVYVGYNTAGVIQAGGVDVIDISVPGAPVVTSQALYADTDVNKVFVNNGFLYTTGATSSGDPGAVLNRITLSSSGVLTSTRLTKTLFSAADRTIPAYAGTSVIANSSYVFSVSGINGGLTVFNAADLSERSFTDIPNARDIALNAAGELAVVSGKTAGAEALIRRYVASTGALVSGSSVTLPNAVIDEGKSTIYSGSVGYVATAGRGGARFICGNDGTNLGSMINPTVTGLTVDETVANAATFGNGLIYVANGEAGVYIYSVERTLLQVGCVGLSLVFRGKFNLGTDFSANNVFYTNGYLVVASGLGGFKIIRVTQSLVSGLLQIL